MNQYPNIEKSDIYYLHDKMTKIITIHHQYNIHNLITRVDLWIGYNFTSPNPSRSQWDFKSFTET